LSVAENYRQDIDSSRKNNAKEIILKKMSQKTVEISTVFLSSHLGMIIAYVIRISRAAARSVN
jgi:hypothetical protein